MKFVLTLLSFLLSAQFALAQEVKIKKNKVYVDGVETLKVGGDANNVSIFDLEGNEIVFLKFIHDSKYCDLYNKITFLDTKISFTSESYIFTKKSLITKLIESGVIVNGQVDAEKAQRFALKFDEKVEEKSIIIEIRH